MIIRKPQHHNLVRAAFTLMEMLVVVAIIVALAGIGGYYFLQQAAQARIKTARAQMIVLEKAVKTYELDYGTRPAQIKDLLVQGPKGGPYLDESRALFDPWGNPYGYEATGATNAQFSNIKPDIWSEGPGNGQKINNWD